MLLKPKLKREQPVLKNQDRKCIICNGDYKAKAPLQKTCSVDCRKIHYKSNQKRFRDANPDAMRGYNQTRTSKDPDVWRRKTRTERLEIIQILGGKCCVEFCSVTNPNHIHIDYIPTMIGTGYRHPRHKRWVLDNIKDFRLLCANHHYELTITGKIEDTNIIQRTKNQ